MKTFLNRILVLAVSFGLAFTASAHPPHRGPGAPGGPGDFGDPGDSTGDHNQGPGDDGGGLGGFLPRIHGFMLQPTADAPDGATGFVAIREDGAQPGVCVSTYRLAPGTYTVNATSQTDGAVTALGTFDVVDLSSVFTGLFGDGSNNQGDFGFALLPFPDGFDPTGIASIQVADADGVTLLTGDNTSPTGECGGPDHQHEHFRLAPTADAPEGASGHVEIEAGDDSSSAPVLDIETSGLADGTYTVTVTALSDGTVTTLGTFAVSADAADDDGGTAAQIAFPDGFDITDVASVSVADADGVLLLDGDGTLPGGGIQGSERLHEEVSLTATTDAPAGATGEARLNACNKEGTMQQVYVRVETGGLDAGTYTVNVTSLADGSVTTLGTFAVAGTDDAGDGNCRFGDGSAFALPTGFNPLDVGTLQVADATGVVLLTGDFSNVATTTTTTFAAAVRITPGAAAPAAKGLVAMSAKVRRHRVLAHNFVLRAKNVPKNATFTLSIDGTAVTTATSDARGRVAMRKLPPGAGQHRPSTVTLTDDSGAKVLTAHF